jgi:hypothetical protein
MASYSAIVLAGGHRTRLQAVTRGLTGDDRPKPVSGLGWNDLGDPRRLLATRERTRTALVSA